MFKNFLSKVSVNLSTHRNERGWWFCLSDAYFDYSVPTGARGTRLLTQIFKNWFASGCVKRAEVSGADPQPKDVIEFSRFGSCGQHLKVGLASFVSSNPLWRDEMQIHLYFYLLVKIYTFSSVSKITWETWFDSRNTERCTHHPKGFEMNKTSNKSQQTLY